jgi:hypothetical protein
MSRDQVLRKRVDGDFAVGFVWQQSGCNPLHFTARLLALEQFLYCHT